MGAVSVGLRRQIMPPYLQYLSGRTSVSPGHAVEGYPERPVRPGPATMKEPAYSQGPSRYSHCRGKGVADPGSASRKRVSDS